MKNKNILYLFLVIFSVSIIITFPSFITAHSLDSYCTMDVGYENTALFFLQAGRLISYLAFSIFSVLNLPFDSLGFISMFLSNLFLSIAVVKTYSVLKNDKKDTNIKKGLLIICSFLIFYNPLINSIFLFDESFVMCLGIMFLTLGAIDLLKKGIKNQLKSVLFIILGVLCYQGIACFLFPLGIMFLSIKKYSKKDIIKKIGLMILYYVVGFISSLIIMKTLSFAGIEVTSKLGNIDLLANLKLIVFDYIPNTFKYLFNYINVLFYYLLIILIILLFIYKYLSDKKWFKNAIFLGLLIIGTTLSSFIPNLFMSTDSNYFATRMAVVVGSLPPLLFGLFIVKYNIKNKKYLYLTLGFSLLVLTLVSINILKYSYLDLKRYREDVSYFNNIFEQIHNYEDKYDVKIKDIYYHLDPNVDYFYHNLSTGNDSVVSVRPINWAMDCALNVYDGKHKYNYQEMSQQDYENFFGDKDYQKFNFKQVKYKDGVIYLLIY